MGVIFEFRKCRSKFFVPSCTQNRPCRRLNNVPFAGRARNAAPFAGLGVYAERFRHARASALALGFGVQVCVGRSYSVVDASCLRRSPLERQAGEYLTSSCSGFPVKSHFMAAVPKARVVSTILQYTRRVCVGAARRRLPPLGGEVASRLQESAIWPREKVFVVVPSQAYVAALESALEQDVREGGVYGSACGVQVLFITEKEFWEQQLGSLRRHRPEMVNRFFFECRERRLLSAASDGDAGRERELKFGGGGCEREGGMVHVALMNMINLQGLEKGMQDAVFTSLLATFHQLKVTRVLSAMAPATSSIFASLNSWVASRPSVDFEVYTSRVEVFGMWVVINCGVLERKELPTVYERGQQGAVGERRPTSGLWGRALEGFRPVFSALHDPLRWSIFPVFFRDFCTGEKVALSLPIKAGEASMLCSNVQFRSRNYKVDVEESPASGYSFSARLLASVVPDRLFCARFRRPKECYDADGPGTSSAQAVVLGSPVVSATCDLVDYVRRRAPGVKASQIRIVCHDSAQQVATAELLESRGVPCLVECISNTPQVAIVSHFLNLLRRWLAELEEVGLEVGRRVDGDSSSDACRGGGRAVSPRSGGAKLLGGISPFGALTPSVFAVLTRVYGVGHRGDLQRIFSHHYVHNVPLLKALYGVAEGLECVEAEGGRKRKGAGRAPRMSACLDAKWRAHLARWREGLAEQRGEGDGARSAAQEVYEKSTIFAVRRLICDLEQLARSVVTGGAVDPAGLVAKVIEQWARRPSSAVEAPGGRVGSKDEKVILAWKKCVEEIEATFQRGPAGDSSPSGSGGAGSTEEAWTGSAAEEPAHVDSLGHSLRATIENIGRLLDYARWRHLEIPREMYEDKEDHVRVTHICTLSGRPPARYTVVQLPGDAHGSPSNGSGTRSAQGAKTTLYRFLETVESATDGLFFVSEQSESYLSKYLRSFRRLEVESLLSGKDCILFARDRAREERGPSDEPSAEVEAVESSALELDERAQAPQPSGLYFTHTCSYRPRKLSFSLLSVFERCAFQFLLKYVLRVQPGRTETAVFSVTGSVIHKLVADAEGRAPASDAQVLDEASLEADAQKKVKDAVVKKLAKADSLTVGQALEKVKEPVIGSEIRAMTRTLKRVTIESRSNKKKSPSSVSYSERKFQVKVLDNVLLIGCWDRVNVTGEDVEIIEYKRVLKNSSKDEISKNMQLMLYAFAWWKMTGVIPKRIVLQQLLHKDLVFAHSPTQEELEALEHKLYEVVKTMKTGRFEASPSLAKCASCAYSNVCPSAVLAGP